jgi:hypothetical protein
VKNPVAVAAEDVYASGMGLDDEKVWVRMTIMMRERRMEN